MVAHSDIEKLMIEYFESHGFRNVGSYDGRNGRNIRASCPFAETTHSSGTDSKPSWGILVETGQYSCFACGERGNLLTLSKKLGLPYFDIKNGIQLSYEESLNRLRDKLTIHDDVEPERIEGLLDNFRIFNFTRFDENAMKAYNWLSVVKGYKDETIRFFGIGYNMNSGNPVFPWTDDDNYIIGWQERNLGHPSFGPKYWNSPGMNKSDYLYNYYNARRSPEVVVVEAFLSVLALHEVGAAAVSAGGASLSAVQAGKLGAFRKVTLCYDHDVAGTLALNDAAEILKKGNFRLFWAAPDKGQKLHKIERTAILPLLRRRNLVNI